MVKKLINKSKFAELAGVTPAAITKAGKHGLAAACVGKKINVNHAAAVAYLAQKEAEANPGLETGIDARYEEAIEFCHREGSYTITGLQRGLSLTHKRARNIVAMMQAAGLVPAGSNSPPVAVTPRPVSGSEARTHTKKSEALENINHGSTVHDVPDDIENFADMTLREIIQRFGSDYAFLDWLKATKAIEDINEKRLKNAQTRGELVSRDLMKRGVIEPIDSAHIKLLTDGSKTIARRTVAMSGAGQPLEEIEKFVADQITSFIRPIKAKVARALREA